MAGCVECIASSSFLLVRLCSDRERSSDQLLARGEGSKKTKSARRVDCFFLPFFPREWPKKPLQKGWGSGTNELFLKERREGKRHAAVEFCLVFQFFLLPSRAHGARAFGDEALTFFFFFFMFCRDTQAEPAVRSRGAGGRRGEKTRRAELFATLERSPER
jgi:hypothetical protein